MPVLAVDLLLEGQLIPLQVAILALMAVLDGDWWKLQHLLELLLRDVHTLLPVLHVLVCELDFAPRVLWLANGNLHHAGRWDQSSEDPSGEVRARQGTHACGGREL